MVIAEPTRKEIDLCKERQIIAKPYRRYCEPLQENALIDYAFLQRHAPGLLENNPGIVQKLQEKYKAILVDEYLAVRLCR